MTPAVDLHPVQEERTFRQAEFDRFGALSGDCNPIHVDPAFAGTTPFGATVAHGMLLFSAVQGLAERAWPGAELVTQALMFPAPTYADEPVRLTLTPLAPTEGGGLRVATRVEKRDGRLGLEGECCLRLPDAGPAPEAER